MSQGSQSPSRRQSWIKHRDPCLSGTASPVDKRIIKEIGKLSGVGDNMWYGEKYSGEWGGTLPLKMGVRKALAQWKPEVRAWAVQISGEEHPGPGVQPMQRLRGWTMLSKTENQQGDPRDWSGGSKGERTGGKGEAEKDPADRRCPSGFWVAEGSDSTRCLEQWLPVTHQNRPSLPNFLPSSELSWGFWASRWLVSCSTPRLLFYRAQFRPRTRGFLSWK